MRNFLLGLIVLLAACQDPGTPNPAPAKPAVVVNHDTIPDRKATVSKKPVASYRVPVGDRRLDRYFGVQVYETPFTFKYVLNMQYEAMEESDTLRIPNFGTWPVIEVHPGKDKLSCIIGFLDEKKVFREYKMLSAQGNQLRLTVLKKYGVGRYRTVYK